MFVKGGHGAGAHGSVSRLTPAGRPRLELAKLAGGCRETWICDLDLERINLEIEKGKLLFPYLV